MAMETDQQRINTLVQKAKQWDECTERIEKWKFARNRVLNVAKKSSSNTPAHFWDQLRSYEEVFTSCQKEIYDWRFLRKKIKRNLESLMEEEKRIMDARAAKIMSKGKWTEVKAGVFRRRKSTKNLPSEDYSRDYIRIKQTDE